MKQKQVNLRLSDEEYELFQRLKMEMIIREKKGFTMTSAIVRLVEEYLNGNKPPSEKPATETNKETIHTDEPGIEVKDNTQLTFDDIEM